jgi:uncharacterized SAM-binding protein YcdF (DUF218 family)
LASTLYLFLEYVEELKNFRAEEKRVDAIVVLTGGTGRADLGLKLLRQGFGGVLVLSGVNKDADVDSIFLTSFTEFDRLSVILEKRSKSTFGNAIEVRGILSERELRSMLLITSMYHMKRAQYIFERIMPADIEMALYPVPNPGFNRNWWKGKGFISAFTEFAKYYWYYLRFSFEDLTV